jgi:5,10-methylenetetrahydromethanopterin reductase
VDDAGGLAGPGDLHAHACDGFAASALRHARQPCAVEAEDAVFEARFAVEHDVSNRRSVHGERRITHGPPFYGPPYTAHRVVDLAVTFSNLPAIGWSHPAARIVELAQLCEDVGFDRFAVADYRYYHDCIAIMGACLAATTRLEVESLVTDPYVRHPSLTATAIATLNDLYGGRAILGIGGGREQPAFWGESRPHPVDAVREAVAVCRGMWRGESVTGEGRVIRTYDARLQFQPDALGRILVAARGRRMLGLAGEIADIAHLASLFVDVEHQRDNIALVLEGATRAGRSADSFEIEVSVPISVAQDRDAARRAARRVAAQGLLWMAGAEKYSRERRDWIPPPQLDVAPDVIEALSGWPMWQSAALPDDLAGRISDEVLDRFSIAGEPAECAERLRIYLAQLPRATGVRLKLPPPLGASAVDDYRRMIEAIGGVIAALHEGTGVGTTA